MAVPAEKAEQYDARIAHKRESWAILDGYYIPTRYPNGLPDSIPALVYNRKAAVEALELAADVVAAVTPLISPDEKLAEGEQNT